MSIKEALKQPFVSVHKIKSNIRTNPKHKKRSPKKTENRQKMAAQNFSAFNQ